jgi:hypothetical protein
VTTRRSPKEDLLVGGLDDWADAGWALQSARLSGVADSAALRDATLSMIAEVLRDRLMVAGDIITGEHAPWHGSADDAVRRITQEWLDESGVDAPTPGAIVWLANTPAGDQRARAVLAREHDRYGIAARERVEVRRRVGV